MSPSDPSKRVIERVLSDECPHSLIQIQAAVTTGGLKLFSISQMGRRTNSHSPPETSNARVPLPTSTDPTS